MTWLAMAVKCHTRIEGPARQDPHRADCAERRRCPFVAPKSMPPTAPVANSRCTTRTGDRINLPALTSRWAFLDTIGLDFPSTVPTTNFCLPRLHTPKLPVRSRPASDFGPTAWKVRNGSIAGICRLRGRERADRQRRKACPSKGRMTGTRAVPQRRYQCGGLAARLSPGKRPSS